MRFLKKIKKGIIHPNLALRKVWQQSSFLIGNDRLYLSVVFFLSHKKKIDWNNPQTFNEKTFWLKLWSKDKGFEKYVDKFLVREYVSNKIGDQYLIPLYGVWDNYSDIDFDSLPENFVLKTTHDSGGVMVIKNKDLSNVESFINKRLANNYFIKGREYPYKNVKPRIIAEKYIVDESGWDLKDYKFFCFNGDPKILFMASERFKTKEGKAKFDYFDIELNRLPFSSYGHASAYKPGEKHEPIKGYEEMLRLAKELSKGFPFIRVDFYNVDGKIYFGELTFFHDDGVVPFNPIEWDKKLGDMIILPESENIH